MQFLSLLDEATEPETRARMLTYILRADKNGLHAIAKDESCVSVLASWIKDLAEDYQAFHILEQLIKVIPTSCIPSTFHRPRHVDFLCHKSFDKTSFLLLFRLTQHSVCLDSK